MIYVTAVHRVVVLILKELKSTRIVAKSQEQNVNSVAFRISSVDLLLNEGGHLMRVVRHTVGEYDEQEDVHIVQFLQLLSKSEVQGCRSAWFVRANLRNQ